MTRSSFFRVRLRVWVASLASLSYIVLCLLLCGAPEAHAEKADREKHIEFQGDTGGGNAETKTGELVGHVVITQGTMTIQADRVTFRQNADNSLSATAYGNPVRFREKRDGADDYYEGYAQRIVYDGEKRFVELFDNALLKKTGNEIRSNYISYSAATDNFSAEGRPDAKPAAAGDAPLGARVRGTFQPKSEDKSETPDKTVAKDKPGAAKDKPDAAKDKDKSAAAKDKGAAAKAAAPLTLTPSGDLAPAK
jgi:lipopolysaccharide export system protein LptA